MKRQNACIIMLMCMTMLPLSATRADSTGKDTVQEEVRAETGSKEHLQPLGELFRQHLEKLVRDIASGLENGMEYCSKSLSAAVHSFTAPAESHGALVKEAIDRSQAPLQTTARE